MKPDLEAIRERAEKAIKGPWIDKRFAGELNVYKGPVKNSSYGLYHDGEICQMVDYDIGDFSRKEINATANFIAHARTDIPILLDYIDELEKRLEK